MEDEIDSQSTVIENLIRRYIVNYCVLIDIPVNINKIVIVASGSSYNAALCGKYFFENIADVPASVEYACEFCESKLDNYDKSAIYIFISQSGNSYDTVEAMKKVRTLGINTMCITNNPESYMYQQADYKFNIDAGLENAIAATKTFTASVILLWILALKTAQNKHLDISSETKNIYQIKSQLDSLKGNIENIDYAAKLLSKVPDFSIFGMGINYPLSREAALKIKETCYINTSSYPMGEFIHGHFALLNKSKLLLTFLREGCSEKEQYLFKKITTTYKAKSIVISDGWEDYNCDVLIKIPSCDSQIVALISMIITVQTLALKIAKRLKRNVDKPLGLNKVVSKN